MAAQNIKTMAWTLASSARDSFSALGRSRTLTDDELSVTKAGKHSSGESPEPTPDADQVESSATPKTRTTSASEASIEKLAPPLLPWEIRGDNGEIEEMPTVKEKIMEMAIYRRTFVDTAGGEEEYSFMLARYQAVAKKLLLTNPNLREMYASIVQSSAFVISEETFWRNFFLRCNTICIDEGLPPYLPEVKASISSNTAIASFQRLKRDLLMKKKRSSDEWERLRRNVLINPMRSTSTDANDPTADVSLGDLDLDLDGEIERELSSHRPSRMGHP